MAVPSSGTLSLVGIRAEIANNAYNANATINSSLKEMSDGTTATINTGNSSSNRPDGSAPHAMSEFYSYDHDISSFNDNKSFDFDGANDYLSGTGTLAAAGTMKTSGSVSVWVKLDSMSSNGFICHWAAEEGTDDQILLLYNNAAGKIRGNVKFGGTANTVDSGSGLENDGSWHHVAFTWDSGSKTSANNIAKIYIDGSLTDSDAIGNTWGGGEAPAFFSVGRNEIQDSNYFNGHLNDLALFSDVLTSSEVSAIYNSGTPKDESSHSGLVAYYHFENYSDGDTSYDNDIEPTENMALTINNSTNIDSSDTPSG